MKIKLFGVTDKGLQRDHNEDNFAICKNLDSNDWSFDADPFHLKSKGALLVVADGMGGASYGEVASDLAQNGVREIFSKLKEIPETKKNREEFLKMTILRVNTKLVEYANQNPDHKGMGSTIVLVWIIDNFIHVAWSGDSRCYVYHQTDNELKPLTQDHSMIWQLVLHGSLTPEQARLHPDSNIITQSLGNEKSPPLPECISERLYKNTRIIVCSDGLNGMLSDSDIQRILDKKEDTPTTCKELVEAANEAGGEDNITCLMCDVLEGDSLEHSSDDEFFKGTNLSYKDKNTTEQEPNQVSQKSYIFKIVVSILLMVVLGLIFWSIFSDSELEEPRDEIYEEIIEENNRPNSITYDGNEYIIRNVNNIKIIGPMRTVLFDDNNESLSCSEDFSENCSFIENKDGYLYKKIAFSHAICPDSWGIISSRMNSKINESEVELLQPYWLITHYEDKTEKVFEIVTNEDIQSDSNTMNQEGFVFCVKAQQLNY
jgi:protein phosphatase